MTVRPTLFCYRSGTSILHRTPTGIKLTALIACTFAVFSSSIPVLAAICIILAVFAVAARTDARILAGNARIILYYGIFIAVFRIIGKPFEKPVLVAELGASAFYIWQLAAVLLAGTLFYETTGTTDIAHTLQKIQKALRWRKPLPDIAFLLSLTLGFIPRIFSTWADLEKAWTARGGAHRKSFGSAIRRTTTLVPLLIINLLAVASDTDRAIRNRSH